MYHGGLCDLKYVRRIIRHVCNFIREKHVPFLVEFLVFYIDSGESHAKEINALYLKPRKSRLAFNNIPVGINTLNMVLPEMCETYQSLRVTCVFSLSILVLKKN